MNNKGMHKKIGKYNNSKRKFGLTSIPKEKILKKGNKAIQIEKMINFKVLFCFKFIVWLLNKC